ncbi:MAG: hypothetical protein VX938_09155, partial [Myxococcota bacterium]|nr:hypothetical protein [Myxococcota bacterium]
NNCLYGDTWEWAEGQWHKVWPLTDDQPPLPLAHHAMAWDPGTGQMLIHGGRSGQLTPIRADEDGPDRLADDGSKWTFWNLVEGGTYQGAIWAWDGDHWAWVDGSGGTLPTDSILVPTFRAFHVMVIPQPGMVMIHGGHLLEQNFFSVTLNLEPTAWFFDLDPADWFPEDCGVGTCDDFTRWGHSAVTLKPPGPTLTGENVAVVLGGSEDLASTSDVEDDFSWKLKVADEASWSADALLADAGINGRHLGAVAYDHHRGSLLVLGAVGDPDTETDWQVSLTTEAGNPVLGEARALAEARPAPPSRSGAASTWDPVREVVWVFGGLQRLAGVGAPLGDLWTWDGQ